MAKIPRKLDLPAWIEANLPTELATSSLFQFVVMLQAMEPDPSNEGKQRRKRILVDILPDLDIDFENIEASMVDLPSQYAFWSAVYSEARLGVAIAERKLKVRKAKVAEAINQEYRNGGLKPPASEVLKTLIESDSRLNEAELSYQASQMQVGKLHHMLESLKMKAELSRSLLSLKKKDRDIN